MALYEFGPNDIFHNQIKTYPQYDFIIYDTKIYLNKRTQITGAFTDSVPMIPPGYISLYEMNVDRPADSMIYPVIVKDGSLTSFQPRQTADRYRFLQQSEPDLPRATPPGRVDGFHTPPLRLPGIASRNRDPVRLC